MDDVTPHLHEYRVRTDGLTLLYTFDNGRVRAPAVQARVDTVGAYRKTRSEILRWLRQLESMEHMGNKAQLPDEPFNYQVQIVNDAGVKKINARFRSGNLLSVGSFDTTTKLLSLDARPAFNVSYISFKLWYTRVLFDQLINMLVP